MTETESALADVVRKTIEDRSQRYLELASKTMERAKPYLDEVERSLFKINAGGIVTTLALIGQALSKDETLAAWLILPAFGFTVSLLASVLIYFLRFTEHMNQHNQLVAFVKTLPEQPTAEPSITSNLSPSIQKSFVISGLGFCLSVLALVTIFVLYAVPVCTLW
ncbi:hypothetical protein [Kordiimonas sp.]|uniref:hypothetical protein n=1 Tax=Kordiimonas sp. TaxID=1970157 RepID=UPI003A93F99A